MNNELSLAIGYILSKINNLRKDDELTKKYINNTDTAKVKKPKI